MSNYKNKFENIKNILKDSKGLTIYEIAEKLNFNRNTAAKYMEILLSTGQVDLRRVGSAKLYYLSKRVPINALLNFSSDYIILLDSQKNIIEMSENFLDFLNIRKKSQNISDLTHPLLNNELFKKKLNEKHDKKVSGQINYEKNKKKFNFNYELIPTTFYDNTYGYTIIFTDITYQKEKEKELKWRVEFEKLLIGIATKFINIKEQDIKKEIDDSLEKIKIFSGVEHCLLYEYISEKKSMKLINRGEKIDSVIDLKEYSWWKYKVDNKEEIYNHFDSIPKGAKEKEFLHKNNIKSLVFVPFYKDDKLKGFLGLISTVDKRFWSEENLEVLKLCGEIFSKSLKL